MNQIKEEIDRADKDLMARQVMDAFRRIVFHYGAWFSEVRHQLGMEKALEVEQKVWEMSFLNQMTRLSKTLGFEIEEGIPKVVKDMPKETLVDLLEKLGVNWLANDGIWFQGVEHNYNMFDAKRCNDTAWARFSPYEATRIMDLLDLPKNGGIESLKKALSFRMYALINKQSIEDVSENCIIFRMNKCRVQDARKRKNLDDYPCKSGGCVEYTTFAETIDKRFKTECLSCPPDDHPEEWYCSWKFTLEE